jgi:group I intron endonuclease
MARERTSGIYRITCLANGRFYIGSAISLDNRKRQHVQALARGDHHNKKMQRSFSKYGLSSLKWEVLEFVEPEHLISREQHFIDTLDACNKEHGFNLYPTAGSSLGSKASDEAKAKMSAAKKGRKLSETQRAMLDAVRNSKPITEETRQKLRDAWLHRGPISQEVRDKIAAAHRGKKQSPEAIEKRIAAIRGRKHSPERIEKRIAPQRGVKRKPLSEEQKAKQSAALKGRRPKNLETLWGGDSLAKRVEKNRGRQRTPEQKARILAGILEAQQRRKEQGIPHPRLGIPRDPETVAKISAANRGKTVSPEARAKMSASKRGVKQSPEVVAKRTAAIREANLRRKAEAARLKAEQRAQATFLRTGIKPAPPENPKRETQGKLFD